MKKILSYLVTIIYILAIVFCLVVLIKPGASIFYQKTEIKPEQISCEENSCKVQYNIDQTIYDPSTILILEDQRVLSFVSTEFVRPEDNKDSYIEIIIKDEASESMGTGEPFRFDLENHQYSIYSKPYLISRKWTGIGLGLLISCFIWFLVKVVIPEKKQNKHVGIFALWQQTIIGILNQIDHFLKERRQPLAYGAVNTILAAYLYLFMEWLFFVTKPSFMDVLPFGEKLKIMFNSAFILTVFALAGLLVLFLLDALYTRKVPNFFHYLYNTPAAFILACLVLILIDNFTYTFFKFGIANSDIVGKIIYIHLFVFVFWRILKKIEQPQEKVSRLFEYRGRIIASLGLIGVSIISVAASYNPEVNTGGNNPGEISLVSGSYPNIILLSSDGVNADNMSVYGYERETTPFLDVLAESSLLSQNNFTNASKSMGSETAILTGKLPLTTHVIFPPNTLRGKDMYQHLPGILRLKGYKTISLGVPYWVDANVINFKNAFTEVNGQVNPNETTSGLFSMYGYEDSRYLLRMVTDRIEERLCDIFFIKDMPNPIDLVTQAADVTYTDEEKIQKLYDKLTEANQTNQSLFAHVHLMDTHGVTVNPVIQKYSVGEEQSDYWMTDFYDDAILSFDARVEELVKFLKDTGQYQKTILIIYTDHGQQWVTNKRLPLIIHFPNDDFHGILTANTQNIDIAPTILDYLNIPIPEWMEGNSILQNLDRRRLIFSAHAEGSESNSILFSSNISQDSLKQFQQIGVIQCQNWFSFDLKENKITQGIVENYINPCPEAELDSLDEIKEALIRKLTGLGYQIPEF